MKTPEFGSTVRMTFDTGWRAGPARTAGPAPWNRRSGTWPHTRLYPEQPPLTDFESPLL